MPGATAGGKLRRARAAAWRPDSAGVPFMTNPRTSARGPRRLKSEAGMTADIHDHSDLRPVREGAGTHPAPGEYLSVTSRALNLLLVDDDESTAILFRFVLQKAGSRARLQVANGGQEAMNYLAGKGEYADRSAYPLPDLIVLDLIMPGVTGLDVLDWRRSSPELSAIPVVVFSGSLKNEDRQQALAKGATRFIPKPVDPPGFKSAIDEILQLGASSRPG